MDRLIKERIMNIKKPATAIGLLLISAQASALSGSLGPGSPGDNVLVYNPAPATSTEGAIATRSVQVAWNSDDDHYCNAGPNALLPMCN